MRNNIHTAMFILVIVDTTAETVPSPPATMILADDGIQFNADCRPFFERRTTWIGLSKPRNKDKTSSPVPPPDIGLPIEIFYID